jgi:hypothetical protein
VVFLAILLLATGLLLAMDNALSFFQHDTAGTSTKVINSLVNKQATVKPFLQNQSNNNAIINNNNTNLIAGIGVVDQFKEMNKNGTNSPNLNHPLS